MIDLAQARAQLDWTRRQLADALQMSVSSVRNFEVGRAIRFPADKVPVLRDLLGGDVPLQVGMAEVGGWRVREQCGTTEREGGAVYDGLQRNFTVQRRGKRAPLAVGVVWPDGEVEVKWYDPPHRESYPSLQEFKRSRDRTSGLVIQFRE